MNIYAFAILLATLCLFDQARAQQLPVTTPAPGFMPIQCLQSIGQTEVGDAGACPGRTQLIQSSSSISLVNNQCGAYIQNTSTADPISVTLPAIPLKNCTFTFVPGVAGFYVTVSSAVPPSPVLLIAGYDGMVSQFTIPHARNPNSYYALQYNGTNWTEAAHSPQLAEAFNPFDEPLASNGQLYFQWDSNAAVFKVLQRNGPGGLIVDTAMLLVPSQASDTPPTNQELWLAAAGTTSSALNYFYVKRPSSLQTVTVDGTANDGGLIQLQLNTTNGANTGDQIWLKCFNINGTIEANGIWTGTVVNAANNWVDLLGSRYQNGFSASPNSMCTTAQLIASPIGHVTSSRGVEIKSDDVHATLVGMCSIGPNHLVSDSSTQRKCASWYNRGVKTCVNEFLGDKSTNSANYVEVSPQIECQFVTWGTGDPTGQSDLSWSISGAMSNNTASAGGAATAGFDGVTPETEQTAIMNPSVAGGSFSLSVKGSKTGLSEGLHYVTLLGKTISGGTVTFSGGTIAPLPATSIEIRIPQ